MALVRYVQERREGFGVVFCGEPRAAFDSVTGELRYQ